MTRTARKICATMVVAVVSGTPVSARNLRDVLTDPRLGTLRLQPALSAIGPALSAAVASTYPVPSASSSVVFSWDADADSFVEREALGSALVGERADTIGRHRLNLGLSYSYVDLSSINGEPLDALRNRASVDGRQLVRLAPKNAPFVLRDGRATDFVPALVHLDLAVRAHVTSASIVYGLTPQLDVGAVLPVVRSSLRTTVGVQTSDPRFPATALCPRFECSTNPPAHQERAASDAAEGVSDLILRAKYATSVTGVADVAAILALALPTGNPRDFQGLGYTRVQPLLAISRYVGDRVQPYANLGIDLDTSDVGRSVARWVVGANVQIARPLTGSVTFLGRHELAAQSHVDLPFFFQVERNDIIDAAFGLRCRLGLNASITTNLLVPLNDDGLRTLVTPTIAVEWVQ